MGRAKLARRRVRYAVGMSLDGFIADADDATDWMTHDRAYDATPFFASVDTVLVGRRSFEVMLRHGQRSYPGLRTIVFSRTLSAADHREVTIVSDDAAGAVRSLRDAPGRDIWLSGGGTLFASLLEAGVVDTVELGVSPILLGRGKPFLPGPMASRRLALTEQRALPSGLLLLSYDVVA
jgi:dihydrofolate reductase